MISEPPASSNILVRVWRRIPVVVRAILTGLLVSSLGIIPWSVFLGLNLRYPLGLPLPWAVPATAGWLAVYWRYVSGRGWPAAMAEARRRGLRARRLPVRAWGWSLLTGVLGLLSCLGFALALRRLVVLPLEPFMDVSPYSWTTIVLLLLMAAMVAGVSEEAGFRGYMQGMIERRHGPVAAILVTGLMFGLVHANHGYWEPILLPGFVAISTVFGAIAWRAGSIRPTVVLHTTMDTGGFLWLWRYGTPPQPPLAWQPGGASPFWLCLLAFLLFGGTAVWAWRRILRPQP